MMRAELDRKQQPKMMPSQQIHKKLRSKLPRRRRRSQLSPLPCISLDSTVSASVDSCRLDCAGEEVSTGTCGGKITSRKRRVGVTRGTECEFRRVTRAYKRRKELEDARCRVAQASVEEPSESSCSDSSLEVCSAEGRSVLKEERACENLKELDEIEASESIALSEISSVQQTSPSKSIELSNRLSRNIAFSAIHNVEDEGNFIESNKKEAVSISSAVELSSKEGSSVIFAAAEDKTIERDPNRALASEFSQTSKYLVDSSIVIASKSDTTIDQKPPSIDYETDLACTEQIASDYMSDYLSSHDSYSEFETELLREDSEEYASQFTLSVSSDSGFEFSEKSDVDSGPSTTFSLLLQYREQFLRSNVRLHNCRPSAPSNELSPTLGFHYKEDAVSYQLLRKRERRRVYLRNYGQEYGKFVLEQRSQMVHWIAKQSTARELHNETLFLGVSLFDRFLSAGHFKQLRNLQIAGIACLTLATRIEENQPYNSVRQKNFCVGSDTYSRCEVVAMEWLVQEVLDFQCALPTIYNFLWFYMRAARADARENKRARDMAALALLDHKLLSYWPSTVAAALVILASFKDASCQRVIQIHIQTEDDDLMRCVESLQWVVKYISSVPD